MNKTILKVKSWSESVIEKFSADNAVNIANVEYEASGWLNGKISSTYVIHYTEYNSKKPQESKSTFTGYSKFVGEIDGKKGSIVFIESGEHSNGLESFLIIKPNTASNEFKCLNGNGKYTLESDKVVLLSDF